MSQPDISKLETSTRSRPPGENTPGIPFPMAAKRRRIERSATACYVKWRNSQNVYIILAELTVVPNSTPSVTRWSASAHTRVNIEVANNADLESAVYAATTSMAADIVFEPTSVRHATTTLTFMQGRAPSHRAAIGCLVELVCWR